MPVSYTHLDVYKRQGTLTVTETKAPNGYLLDGAYMQADGSSEPVSYTHLSQYHNTFFSLRLLIVKLLHCHFLNDIV